VTLSQLTGKALQPAKFTVWCGAAVPGGARQALRQTVLSRRPVCLKFFVGSLFVLKLTKKDINQTTVWLFHDDDDDDDEIT